MRWSSALSLIQLSSVLPGRLTFCELREAVDQALLCFFSEAPEPFVG
jgi:hypothetical protein